MHTLPQPERLSFFCFDRNGRRVEADVVAIKECGYKPWVWRAVFHDTGEPPAELMGASEALDQVERDIRNRVASLQVVGAVMPEPGQVANPLGADEGLKAAPSPDQVLRSVNLAAIVAELAGDDPGGRAFAAEILDLSAAHLGAMLDGGAIPDELARDIEWAAQKPSGWLDRAREYEPV